MKDAIQAQDGIAGALTYQVRVNDDMSIYSNIMASAKMEYDSFGVPISEVIGGATAGAAGICSADVSLPDRAVITQFKLTQGSYTFTCDPRVGVPVFPFTVATSPIYIEVTFDDGDQVENVKIAGFDTDRQGDSFKCLLLGFPNEIVVQYDEDEVSEEDILLHDFGLVPDYLVNADVEFVNGTTDDVNLEFGAEADHSACRQRYAQICQDHSKGCRRQISDRFIHKSREYI